MDHALTLEHVSKDFGPVHAVQDVSLAVQPGEVVAFLGPNGAGKTTTISMMLGLRNPTRGRVSLFGLDPRDRRGRSRCGVMLQESGVPQQLKVRELVDLFRSYYPAPLTSGRAIEMAGLNEKAGALVGTLSGGQRQRLFFALAICGDPELIFLDEPTVALDVEGRRSFWAEVRDFVRSGKTIVLTTHYLDEADVIADRIVVINHGRVIADDAPAAIKSRVAGKHVSFDSSTPLTAADFASFEVQGLTIDGGRVSLLSQQPEAVLRELFARGVDLRNLEVAGAGLEEAFLSLTAPRGG